MKKFKSLVIKSLFCLYCFYGCQSEKTKIIDVKDFRKFCLTFQNQYKKNVEQTITLEKYLKYFELYDKTNLTFNCSVSTNKGASIEFIPSNKNKFNFNTTDSSIEDYIFKDINLRVDKDKIPPQNIPHVVLINKRGLKIVTVRVDGGGTLKWYGNEIITNEGKFIELIDDKSSAIFKSILVDKVFFPNYLLIKGSNKKLYWKKKEAKRIANEIFDIELFNAYFTSEEFRKFCLAPKLYQLARNIEEKRKKGSYGDLPMGALELEADLKELKEVAIQNDFPVEFTEIVLKAQRDFVNKKTWFERHPVITGVIGGLIVILLTFLYRRRLEIGCFIQKVLTDLSK